MDESYPGGRGLSGLAVLAPGQGAQRPGMLLPWLTTDVRQLLDVWSQQCDVDLLGLGTTASAADLVDTAVAQPLLVATALIAYRRLAQRVSVPAWAPVAGHSVGELVAMAIADVITEQEAVVLAAARGRAMAAACGLDRTGMSAVMGPDVPTILAVATDLGLTPANVNSSRQLVLAGDQERLRRLADRLPADVKVVPLKVAGAFHTAYMRPAQQMFARVADRVDPGDPSRPLLSNADGRTIETGTEAMVRLVAQITEPVRWDLCMAGLGDLGVSLAVELPPAGVLSGMLRHGLPHVARRPLISPEALTEVETGNATEPAGQHRAAAPPEMKVQHGVGNSTASTHVA